MICSSRGTILIYRGKDSTFRLPVRVSSSNQFRNNNLPITVTTFRRSLPSSSSSMAVETMSDTSTLLLTSGASGRVRALFSMRELKRLVTIIHALILFILLPFRVVVWRRRSGAVAIRDEKQERKVWSPPQIVVRKRGAGGSESGCSVAPPSVPAAVVDEEVAVRRELAMRRVLEDEGGDGSSVRDFSLFPTKRGDTLFTQSWSPVSPNHRSYSRLTFLHILFILIRFNP